MMKLKAYLLLVGMVLAGCSGDDYPSWVRSAEQDIATSINHDISGCNTKIYHKDSEWFVLCYSSGSPVGGGALFEVFNNSDSGSGYDFYVMPISGLAKQYVQMDEFNIIKIPVKEASMEYSSSIMERYFQRFD